MTRIRKAARAKVKLKIAVSGLSGSGKTYSSLLLARGMVDSWEEVGLIDTENGSGELYSHMGPYQYLDIRYDAAGKPVRDPHSPESYIAAIKEMYQAGVKVIVIDSMTHEWDGLGGCLESVERLGGKFSDWAKVTPRHKAFLDAILHVPAHVIATMRRKSDYAISDEERAGGGRKQKIEKVGLKEVQREGVEYEFTVQFTIDRRHLAVAEKDRTGMYRIDDPFTITSETGQQLAEWARGGASQDEARIEKSTGEPTGVSTADAAKAGQDTLADVYEGKPEQKRILKDALEKAGIKEPSAQIEIHKNFVGQPLDGLAAKIEAMKGLIKQKEARA